MVLPLNIIGTRDIRRARAAEGSRPLTRARITGTSLMKDRNGIMSMRYEMFEMTPTAADGIDQKMIITAMKAWIANLLTTRDHQLRFRACQITSVGPTPMKRGAM